MKAVEGSLLYRLEEKEWEREMEEEKRSLYVAATRASDMLVITFSSRSGKNTRPWRDLVLKNLLISNEDIVLPASGFEGIIEILQAPPPIEPHSTNPEEAISLDIEYIDPVKIEAFKEHISPTILTATDKDIQDRIIFGYDTYEEIEAHKVNKAYDRRDLGKLAHHILEPLGEDGRTFAELIDAAEIEVHEAPHGELNKDRLTYTYVLDSLRRLGNHALIKEIEASEDSKAEYRIMRPLEKYMLYGRLDKIILTSEGWKIIDYKFADSKTHKESYEFQMKFYLYIARGLFDSIKAAEIFYLKDGGTREIVLNNIQEFEGHLQTKINEILNG
ncbi:MAG: hypothetical protein HPY61_07710 [Methanotrichaceae archaeon]|nr:hypothetical protein [Methanotrichaceae archaeon]